MDVTSIDVNWLFVTSSAFLIIALWQVRKRRIETEVKGGESAGRLAEVIKSAEVANDGFFRSLELVQKNLESLIARAETMEQRLQSLMLHSGIEKREQYTAAALLLAEGQEAERVASMLNLPSAQVSLIRDLQQVTAKDKRAAARSRRSEVLLAKETTRQSKNAAPLEKTAARPILLVDVIKNAVNETGASDDRRTRLEGVTA
ncbi:MAG TPA: hypothetical protein VMO00_03280 [Methylomirabilota bacterium]|nr:hypothetical protein [Methylomirabilota bacterium]